MNLLYKSTRSNDVEVTASQAILKGLADDGGLFVPESLPALEADMDTLAGMSYQETAYEVMRQFLTDFTEEELKDCIAKAYDEKFDTKEIAPLVKKDEAYYLELFHGKTIAFKDMALSILPHLLTTSAKKNQVKNEIVILTATSGDTGKAALAGFADVPGTKIIVFTHTSIPHSFAFASLRSLISVIITFAAPIPFAACATRFPIGPAPRTAIFMPATSPICFTP